MKVAAIQTDIVWEDREANLERLTPRIAEAAATGAGLVLLPELFAYGFSMDTGRIAEPPDGECTLFLLEGAKTHGCWVGGSIPVKEEGADRPHNAFVLAGPNGETHTYRKIHPFTYDGEHEHYDAGSELVTVEVEGLRLTLFVCYDLRFADEFWQQATETDAYLLVANWPAPRRNHWRTLLRARAIENQAYVVGLNRIGVGGGERPGVYAGDSAIIDPWGKRLVEAGDEEAILVAELDGAKVSEARRRFPVLRDRR